MWKWVTLALVVVPWIVRASLVAGDIAFIGFNVDGDDDFAIVALTDITNERVFFRDDEPDGSSGFHGSTEGTLQWDVGATTIPAGTVVVFTDVDSGSNPGFGASVGSLSIADNTMNLAAAGDGLWAYQATTWDAINTMLIAGIANDDWGGAAVGELTGTGLVDDSTAFEFSIIDDDAGKYSGARDNQTEWSAYLAQIANPANWTVEASEGELLLPFDATPFQIPEPSALALALAGGFALLSRRHQRFS